MNDIASDPYKFGSIENKTQFMKRKKDLEAQKVAISPPAITDEERASLVRRQETLEAFIKLESPDIKKPAMPSKIEMWESPAGAKGKHLQWDKAIKKYTINQKGDAVHAVEGYGAVSEWKDNQRKLYAEAEADDPDIANIEQLRPQNRDKSSFGDYKRITFGSTARYRQAYDDVFGKGEYEAGAEALDAPAPVVAAGKEVLKKEPNLAARKAASDRMKKYHEDKRAAKLAAQTEE